MNHGIRTLFACSALLVLGLAAAQRLMPVLLVMPSGQAMEYSLDSRSSADGPVSTACYAASDAACRLGFVTLDVDGSATDVPLALIARADLVSPGTDTVWRFTLKDGRVLDGFVQDATAHLYVDGVSDCCQNLVLHSYPRRPDRQAFVAIIFDLEAIPPSPSGGS